MIVTNYYLLWHIFKNIWTKNKLKNTKCLVARFVFGVKSNSFLSTCFRLIFLNIKGVMIGRKIKEEYFAIIYLFSEFFICFQCYEWSTFLTDFKIETIMILNILKMFEKILLFWNIASSTVVVFFKMSGFFGIKMEHNYLCYIVV